MTIQETYDKLRKQHGTLPPFNRLDFEFEIATIEESIFLLREIRKRIMEKLDGYAQFLEELIQPEPTVANLRESQDFTSREKAEMYDFYKRLMIAHRAGMEVSIIGGDKEHAAYIAEIYKDWEKVKKQMLAILKKVKDSWLKDTEVDVDVSYFG